MKLRKLDGMRSNRFIWSQRNGSKVEEPRLNWDHDILVPSPNASFRSGWDEVEGWAEAEADCLEIDLM